MLGTGTSHGVPVIGCDCAVCKSRDPKDRRTRCSAWIRQGGASLLIDAATEHRLQALREGIRRVDAVLFTHGHADHVSGADDLRIYGERQDMDLPCFGNRSTLEKIRRQFCYVFQRTQLGGGKPRLKLKPVKGPFDFMGIRIVPVPLFHGRLAILGWRLGPFAYLTDTNRIPEASFRLLTGLKVLVLDALRPKPHSTHFSLPQAVEVARRIHARRTYFTHITHLLPHRATNRKLPKGMELAWDGLKINL
jgi:phosphoribosyl 1,2-cyclic phosphate phosphodiesterase